jgi:hypothetical protein
LDSPFALTDFGPSPAACRSILAGVYDEDFEPEDDDQSRRPLILAHQIDAELKAEYVALIADGLDPGSAARELGSTGSQFRKHRSPNSIWYDPAFADQVEAARHSDQRKSNLLERLEEHVWKAIEKGDIRMLEKMLYAYHPDFEKLRHTNLRVSGEIVHAAKVLLPHLSDEEIQARLNAIEQKEGVRLLPPPKDEAA